MAWVLTLLLHTGFATMEVRSPAHCWVALSWAIRQARLYETALPSTGFAIKGASCKRVGGIRA
jgi:hypothetical protein